jgi:sec-independent protein translocase protein TatA
MGWDAPWHWVVLAILVLLLFGYKKLPDATRSLVGRSLRIFKSEMRELTGSEGTASAAYLYRWDTRPRSPRIR